MQRFGLIYTQQWYLGLPLWQKDLIRTSVELFSREERLHSAFDDYSFVVFPMAKAYEGFLKYYLFMNGLIPRQQYYDKHFRIGRALNPDLHREQRDENWKYDDVAEHCGQQLARQVWETWLHCRNQVFHYFPDRTQKLSLEAAEHCLEMLAQTMEELTLCSGPILRASEPPSTTGSDTSMM